MRYTTKYKSGETAQPILDAREYLGPERFARVVSAIETGEIKCCEHLALALAMVGIEGRPVTALWETYSKEGAA